MKHFFSLRPWILAAVVLASAGTTVAAQGKMEAYPANEKWFVKRFGRSRSIRRRL